MVSPCSRCGTHRCSATTWFTRSRTDHSVQGVEFDHAPAGTACTLAPNASSAGPSRGRGLFMISACLPIRRREEHVPIRTSFPAADAGQLNAEGLPHVVVGDRDLDLEMP